MISKQEAKVLGRYLQRLGAQLEHAGPLLGTIIGSTDVFNLSIDISAVGLAVRGEQVVAEVLDEAGKKELGS